MTAVHFETMEFVTPVAAEGGPPRFLAPVHTHLLWSFGNRDIGIAVKGFL